MPQKGVLARSTEQTETCTISTTCRLIFKCYHWPTKRRYVTNRIIFRSLIVLYYQICQGLLMASRCRRSHYVPITGVSADKDGLKYEEWVPISFLCGFACDADALRYVCHPWDENGYRVRDVKYLVIYENQSHRKLSHENCRIRSMSNY
jgi:hypothetical protein